MSRANYIPDDFPKLKEYIENKILNDKWSPDAIDGYIISHELYKQDGFTSNDSIIVNNPILSTLRFLFFKYSLLTIV